MSWKTTKGEPIVHRAPGRLESLYSVRYALCNFRFSDLSSVFSRLPVTPEIATGDGNGVLVCETCQGQGIVATKVRAEHSLKMSMPAHAQLHKAQLNLLCLCSLEVLGCPSMLEMPSAAPAKGWALSPVLLVWATRLTCLPLIHATGLPHMTFRTPC